MVIVDVIKKFIGIFFEGTGAVKLDLVPRLNKPEVRNIEQ